MENIKWVLEEIFFEAEHLSSLALTLEMAMTTGDDTFVGAAHILADLLSNHAKKLEALIS